MNILKTSKNNSRCDVHMLPKTLIVKRLKMWLQFLGDLMCFHLVMPWSLNYFSWWNGHTCQLIMFEITRVLFLILYYYFPWVKCYTYVQHLVYIFIYIKRMGSRPLIFCMCPIKCSIVQASIGVELNLHIVAKETCILYILFLWSCVFNMFKYPFV